MKYKIMELVNLVLEANAKNNKIALNIQKLENGITNITVYDISNKCEVIGEHVYLDENLKDMSYSYGLDNLIKELCQIK